MRRFLENIALFVAILFLLIPILGFQKQFAVVNMLVDIPIFLIINFLFILYFLETQVQKYIFQSTFLLNLAAISVFATFLRIIPLPAGLTLSFLVPIAAGATYGAEFGFLVGQLSMLMGGIVMGAVGPWLPYQSLTMGFVAYYAGIFFYNQKSKLGILLYVSIASIFYGYWLSTTYWPMAMITASASSHWTDRLRSYTEYYMITSFAWDVSRVVGNLILFRLVYDEVCELLQRGKQRLNKKKNYVF